MPATSPAQTTLIRRKATGEYASTVLVLPGYRHLTFTRDIALAGVFSEALAAEICDRDVHGVPLVLPGYNGSARPAEYERVPVPTLLCS